MLGEVVHVQAIRSNSADSVDQYVKQEILTSTKSGKEARATRLITERASRRIGRMAFDIAKSRPRKVFVSTQCSLGLNLTSSQLLTIIHKSNVLSVTDGLFRETVRGIPRLYPDSYNDVIVAEQIVDSAIYKFVS